MEKEQVWNTVELCRRLEPIIERFLEKTATQYGPEVTMNVLTNISTSMMAHAILLADVQNGNTDQFREILMTEVRRKYMEALSQMEADIALHKMISAGNDTCRPLH